MNKLQTMKKSQSIGVDVSKRTLDITGYADNKTKHIVINNERQAIRKFLLRLKGYQGPIICESTGWYHYLFSHLCYEADLDIRVINPLLSSKHSKSAIRKVKSDPADSRCLAIMGVTEPNLPARPRLSLNRIKFRRKQGLLHSLEKQSQSMKQRMTEYEACATTLGVELSEVEQLLCVEIKTMDKLKRALSRELEQLAMNIAEEEGSSNYEVFTSVPGFSNVVSSLLDVSLDPNVNSAKSWIGYVGIDISVRQSGTWIGRSRLTKRGNRYLRKRLYQAAWGACLNYPEIRAYYDHLKTGGRKHVEAVIMIARKLLRIAFTLIQKQEVYNPDVAFPG